MLKKRIAANLVIRDGIVVQSKHFNTYLPVGKPEIAVEFLNQWGIDEIIISDISATQKNREPDYSLIKKLASKCQVPLTIGGGISNLDHIKKLMNCGADKISLNQTAIHNDKLISQSAKIFGNQCIVISIDSCIINKEYKVYDYIKRTGLNISPSAFAKKTEELGAGEILINSIERDGSCQGFDKVLFQSICDNVSIPVIGLGGAKNAGDIIDALKNTKISAVSAANFFHFSEHSVIITKASVNKHLPVRIDTLATYQNQDFNSDFRLNKKDDSVLEKMLFVKIEKEII